MPENNNTPIPQITEELAIDFLKKQNKAIIDVSEIAKIKNGEQSSNDMLNSIVDVVSKNSHGTITKSEREKMENHFKEISGLEKQNGESVFDFMKRGVNSLKGNVSDSKELKGIIESQKSAIEKLNGEISTFKVSTKKASFKSEFTPIFDEELKKYDIVPQLAKRLRSEISDKIFSDKMEADGSIIYRKGDKIYDADTNPYTQKTLISDYLKAEGFSIVDDKNRKAPGTPIVKNTIVDKDNQNNQTIYQKAMSFALKEAREKGLNTMQRNAIVQEKIKELQKK